MHRDSIRGLMIAALAGAGVMLAEKRGLLPKGSLARLPEALLKEGETMPSLSHRRWRSRAKKRGAELQKQSQILTDRRERIRLLEAVNADLRAELADRHPSLWKRLKRWVWGA